MHNGTISVGADPQPQLTQAAPAQETAQGVAPTSANEVVRIDGYQVAIPKEEGAYTKVHALFAERRPNVFQRLLKQLTVEGYNIRFSYIGFENVDLRPFAVVAGFDHPLWYPSRLRLRPKLNVPCMK